MWYFGSASRQILFNRLYWSLIFGYYVHQNLKSDAEGKNFQPTSRIKGCCREAGLLHNLDQFYKVILWD